MSSLERTGDSRIPPERSLTVVNRVADRLSTRQVRNSLMDTVVRAQSRANNLAQLISAIEPLNIQTFKPEEYLNRPNLLGIARMAVFSSDILTKGVNQLVGLALPINTDLRKIEREDGVYLVDGEGRFIDATEIEKWLDPEKIKKIKAVQGGWLRMMARFGMFGQESGQARNFREFRQKAGLVEPLILIAEQAARRLPGLLTKVDEAKALVGQDETETLAKKLAWLAGTYDQVSEIVNKQNPVDVYGRLTRDLRAFSENPQTGYDFTLERLMQVRDAVNGYIRARAERRQLPSEMILVGTALSVALGAQEAKMNTLALARNVVTVCLTICLLGAFPAIRFVELVTRIARAEMELMQGTILKTAYDETMKSVLSGLGEMPKEVDKIGSAPLLLGKGGL